MKSVFLAVVFSTMVAVTAWFAPETVFAQVAEFTAEQVEFESLVEFNGDNGIIAQIKKPLATILAGAIGIGLAVWVARFFFKIVRSMGRG
jgi:hypothetical protein